MTSNTTGQEDVRAALIELNAAIDAMWNDTARDHFPNKEDHRRRITAAQQVSLAALSAPAQAGGEGEAADRPSPPMGEDLERLVERLTGIAATMRQDDAYVLLDDDAAVLVRAAEALARPQAGRRPDREAVARAGFMAGMEYALGGPSHTTDRLTLEQREGRIQRLIDSLPPPSEAGGSGKSLNAVGFSPEGSAPSRADPATPSEGR